jgi:response regulator of citrate/malate metabolism
MEKKVIIVEDESIISFGYRMQLEALGFNVIGIAKSADEARRLVANERPDLLIMDIYLKGEMTGLEYMEELHSTDKIPAIFLTASMNNEMIERIKELNNCDFLPKPVNGSKLRELLQKHAI